MHEPRWQRFVRSAIEGVAALEEDGPREDAAGVRWDDVRGGRRDDVRGGRRDDVRGGRREERRSGRGRNGPGRNGRAKNGAPKERMRTGTDSAAARWRGLGRAGQTWEAERPRVVDLRLVCAVSMAWAAAAVSGSLSPRESVGAGGAFLALSAAGLLACSLAGRIGHAGGRQTARTAGNSPPTASRFRRMIPVLALGTACAGSVLVGSGLHAGSPATAPLAHAMAAGQSVLATLSVSSLPRAMTAGADRTTGESRVMVQAVVTQVVVAGRFSRTRTAVVVLGDGTWLRVAAGDVLEVPGRLSAGGGDPWFHPLAAPLHVGQATGWEQGTLGVRNGWLRAVHAAWGTINDDVSGLLPGMVMGERGQLPASLNDAMKITGLTHLTAVSGANCTLVLAGLLGVARSLRISRALSACVCVLGLAGFVLIVGPDPSVLRAAVMGSIGCAAMVSGRPRRVGALLAVTVVVLLVADASLAADYAFVLSVLATFGLLILGQRCAAWLGGWLPWWLAQAVAIPLAAQLFCSPVIVLLAPRLTVYAVPANILVAPVIAGVTTLGTAGMVLAPLLPSVATGCAHVAGAGSWWVAVVARGLAQLPGATVPWPEGPAGAVLLGVANTAFVCALWALVHRDAVTRCTAQAQARHPRVSRILLRFPTVAVACAGIAGLVTWGLGSA